MEPSKNPSAGSPRASAPARKRDAAPLPGPDLAVPGRLLPWSSPEGKQCHLVTDDPGSYLSRFADDVEAEQLAVGRQTLADAGKVLADPMSPYGEVRYAGIRLAECLADAVRVAESRGMRLPVHTGRPDGGTGDGSGGHRSDERGDRRGDRRAEHHGDRDRDRGDDPDAGPGVPAEGGVVPTVKERQGR
ncbi:hypothetical protein AB0I99_02040 [Streptomyces spongiicola]|uniref:hypothetical protein n=1 Tax=Streptomyces spongiicola TaxID=1690221 RepID=UPI0033D5151E